MVRRTLALFASLLLTAALVTTPDLYRPAVADPVLANPGFEASGPSQNLPGWETWSGTGDDSASYTEEGGRGGGHRLAHWASFAYQVETYQWLQDVPAGHYTLSVWVRSSGGQNEAYIALRDCGASVEPRTAIPQTSGSTWVEVTVSAEVTAGMCTISLNSDANPGNWINFDDVTFAATDQGGGQPGQTVPIRGGDVSTLAKNEAFGAVYYDSAGNQRDPLELLAEHGMNYVRLKVWVNPADGFNSKQRVLEVAQRSHALGMGLLVDFHYSDFWADPGRQDKPAAWQDLSFSQLRDAVYDHTYDVVSALADQGTPADMVQVGNEITNGMLWPDGSTDNWDNLAQLLTAGATAVKDVSSDIDVMLHLDRGGNNDLYRWWFDQATSRGVPFDVIGLSHYTYWHGSLGDLQANLNDISARYDKPVAVVEFAYGFTLGDHDGHGNIFNSELEQAGGYPATPAGQAAVFRDIFEVVASVPGGRGLGVFYWEPAWTGVPGAGWDPTDPSSGNAWENQALFDFDYRALPAIEVFGGF